MAKKNKNPHQTLKPKTSFLSSDNGFCVHQSKGHLFQLEILGLEEGNHTVRVFPLQLL